MGSHHGLKEALWDFIAADHQARSPGLSTAFIQNGTEDLSCVPAHLILVLDSKKLFSSS